MSTLVQALATLARRIVVDLDEPTTRDAVEASPSAFASADPPVFLDEYQHVPSILDAIKAELNRDLRAGRFVLTGSNRYASLPTASHCEPHPPITPWPLSQDEINGIEERFAERLLTDPASSTIECGYSQPTRRERRVCDHR